MKKRKLLVEYRKTGNLIPYVNNARSHSDLQVQKIASSIKEFGFTNPLLVDEDKGIIAGHGRFEAAILLKMKDVPTIMLKGLSEPQKKAYMLADNKLALNSEWNYDLLKIELAELDDANFDLELIGFGEYELIPLLDDTNVVDPSGEWAGMPEFDQKDAIFRTIVLHFKDQQAVDEFAKVTDSKITDTTRYLWYPEIEIDKVADKEIVANSDGAKK